MENDDNEPEFELTPKFDFVKLPTVALQKILEYLSFWDKSYLMAINSWFHWRVSTLCPQKMRLGRFRINMTDSNDYTVSRTQECLTTIKTNPLAHHMMLDIYFSQFIPTESHKEMKEILDEYRPYISKLAFTNTGKENFLVEPVHNLPNLTKLVIKHEEERCTVDKREEVERLGIGLIQLYAENLTSLSLYRSVAFKYDLSGISLPKLEHLVLWFIFTDKALPILGAYRSTITHLELSDWYNIRPLMPAEYHIPNLKYFCIPRTNGNILQYANFIRTNAATLEAMTVGALRTHLEPDWPEFPRLRQLGIVYSNIISILPRCAKSLERLVVWKYSDDVEISPESLVLPKLKDLYLIETSSEFARELIKNAINLEFLYIYDLSGDIEEIFNMENDLTNIKHVLLDEHTHTKEETQIYAEALPNAEILRVHRRTRRYKIKNRGNNVGYNPAFLNELADFLH